MQLISLGILRARAVRLMSPCAAVAFGLLSMTAPAQSASVIYESATFGSASGGGNSLYSDQYLGAGFSVADATQVHVTGIGGNINTTSGNLFGTIVALPSAGSLPSFAPSAIESNALGSVTFATGNPGGDVIIPLSLTLAAGDYALIFGSGAFGTAGGGGSMALTNTDIGSPFYFFHNEFGWQSGGNPNKRFVVEGTVSVIPIPAALPLFFSGLLGLGVMVRRRKQKAVA